MKYGSITSCHEPVDLQVEVHIYPILFRGAAAQKIVKKLELM